MFLVNYADISYLACYLSVRYLKAGKKFLADVSRILKIFFVIYHFNRTIYKYFSGSISISICNVFCHFCAKFHAFSHKMHNFMLNSCIKMLCCTVLCFLPCASVSSDHGSCNQTEHYSTHFTHSTNSCIIKPNQ